MFISDLVYFPIACAGENFEKILARMGFAECMGIYIPSGLVDSNCFSNSFIFAKRNLANLLAKRVQIPIYVIGVVRPRHSNLDKVAIEQFQSSLIQNEEINRCYLLRECGIDYLEIKLARREVQGWHSTRVA